MTYAHVQRAHHILTKHGQLHVIAVCFNPNRYIARYRLYREFVKRSICEGALVHVAELCFGNRPPEVVPKKNSASHWTFRTDEEVWQKEAMINAAVSRLPSDWKYVAWVDADVSFVNPHWVQETIQQLQHFAVVQMFHTAIDYDPENLPMRTFKGYVATAIENPDAVDTNSGGYYYVGKKAPQMGYWHPGYAWACTRNAWDTMGGLLDINIVGGGDHQMANAFYGRADKAIPFKSTQSYRKAVMGWQSHALLLKQNLGFVPGTLNHYWHGKKVNRRYFDRWKILADSNFDPVLDLRRDWQGLLQLAGNKPKLRDDLRAYFRSRQEDSIDK